MPRKAAAALVFAVAFSGLATAVAVAGDPNPALLTRLEEDRGVGSGGLAEGLEGAHSVAASPDNKNVYVTATNDSAVVTFTREASGALTRLEEDRDVQSGGNVPGLDAAEGVVVSPNGKNVYVTGAVDSAVVTFKRNTTTGALKHLQTLRDRSVGGNAEGLDHANAVAISANGKHVYVTASGDSAVVSFKVLKDKKGKLKRIEQDRDVSVGGAAEGLDSAQGLAVAPDGKHVYVTGAADDAVVTFRRNNRKGKLTRLEEHRDVAAGGSSEGLDNAVGVAASPDNENVYVAASDDNTVVTFSRDTTTGLLTRVEEDRDESNGGSADGLDGAVALAVAPDGDFVFLAARDDNTLVALARDGGGLLAPSEVHRDVSNGGSDEGLDGARGVAVPPDDGSVYVTGRDDDAVVTFDNVGG
jgi:6-phosphogluconolactonase (cycloisomerase 2 family)